MIILTGFEPFGNYAENLSGEIAKNFPPQIRTIQVKKGTLPVSWKRAIEDYKKILLSIKTTPNFVIHMGIHEKNIINLERFGTKCAIGKDVDGKYERGIRKLGGPDRYNTLIDLKKIYRMIKDQIDIKISHFAGCYLCNYIYYWSMHFSEYNYPVLFIHIPHNGDFDEYMNKIKIIIEAIISITQ